MVSLYRHKQLEHLAAERGVRLLVHVTPRYRWRRGRREPAEHAEVKDCVVERLPPHRVIDLRSSVHDDIHALITEPRYFQNRGHFNETGAILYSRSLARILQDRHP